MLLLSFVVGVVTLLRSFGVALSDGQVDAITELSRAGIEILLLMLTGEVLRKGVTPMVAVLLLFLAFPALTGCEVLRQQAQYAQENPGDFAEQLAQQACTEHYSRARKIDLSQAQEDFCASRPQWLPWLKPILDALARGDGRALARDVRAAERE